jgi:hypothetical protein
MGWATSKNNAIGRNCFRIFASFFFDSPVYFEWRKPVGVEPTSGIEIPLAGFEARAQHRPGLASVAIVAVFVVVPSWGDFGSAGVSR